MTDKHYYRPHFEQLMESIEPYNGYMQRQLDRTEAVIETEGVS